MAPSRAEIEAIFKNMETGNYAAVFEHVSPDVDWTVMGKNSLIIKPNETLLIIPNKFQARIPVLDTTRI
jgi:hypothetical protein